MNIGTDIQVVDGSVRYLAIIIGVSAIGVMAVSYGPALLTRGGFLEPDLSLPTPAGHCSFSEEDPSDAHLLAFFRQSNAGRKRVLGGFADCDQLERWRRGEGYLRNFGLYLMATNTDLKVIFMSRSRYLEVIAREAGNIVLMNAVARRNARKAQEINPAIKINKTETFGIVDVDEYGAFMALTEEGIADDGRTRYAVGGIVGYTLIDGQAVSIDLYAPFEGEATFQQLLREQKDNLRTWILANSD